MLYPKLDQLVLIYLKNVTVPLDLVFCNNYVLVIHLQEFCFCGAQKGAQFLSTLGYFLLK
jgi:hypothetical protein